MTYENILANAPNELFRALADPRRRLLLESLLRGGGQTVGALTGQAGISQPAVSQHLSVLKQAGLVRDQAQGRSVLYHAEPQGLAPLIDWIEFHTRFWTERLDRLDALLERLEE